VCNREEAEAIARVKGQRKSSRDLAPAVADVMNMRAGRNRLVAVTDGKEGSHLIYGADNGSRVEAYIPAVKVQPKHPTGAGDNYLLGLVYYITENREAFERGRLNVGMAGRYGSAMGALHIAGEKDRIKSPADLDAYVAEKFPQRLEESLPQPGKPAIDRPELPYRPRN
jgi:sugar/nucleoside kinase (ribokinase family)